MSSAFVTRAGTDAPLHHRAGGARTFNMAQDRSPHNMDTTALRQQLLAIGCEPLPATLHKEVLWPKWPTRRINEAVVRSWERQLKAWPNTGDRCTFSRVWI